MVVYQSSDVISPQNAARAFVDTEGLDRFWAPATAKALENVALARADEQVLGDGPQWFTALETLARLGPTHLDGSLPAPTFVPRARPEIGTTVGSSPEVLAALKRLSPWRKGPFDVLGVYLDAEWRCDLKWSRLERAIVFEDKRIVDVGCGNGYYLLRALGCGARAALGVDPTWLYVAQFAALRSLVHGSKRGVTTSPLRAWVLPVGIEDVPTAQLHADIVFSMGVIYHRKSPLEHLEQLRAALAPGGALLLESLVVPGDERTILVPASRYAQMRNVWFIPSVEALVLWLRRVGFSQVEVIDVSTTTSEEQRTTPFMNSLSLSDFLDPDNIELTVEGYPRPCRAMLVARR